MAMTATLAPALFAVAAWWFGTAAILLLDRAPRHTHRWSFALATALLPLAYAGLWDTRDDTRAAGAYWGFGLALAVWAWQELAFLLGYVTGPRRTPCPPGAQGLARVRLAVQTILYHELVLVLLGTGIWAATQSGTNAAALWTWCALWLMRLSAKLNLFLGVRNLGASMLPEHLRYLGSYFRVRPMNGLFPLSALGAAALAAWVWSGGLGMPGGAAHAEAEAALIGTLLLLALLEHAFMVLPWGPEAMWTRALRPDTDR